MIIIIRQPYRLANPDTIGPYHQIEMSNQ